MSSDEKQLYEEWKSRRERLENAESPQGPAYNKAQARIYTYLLKRYQDTVPERAYRDEPARPRLEPRTKAASILRRIKLLAPQNDTKAPGNKGFWASLGWFISDNSASENRSDWKAFCAEEARRTGSAAQSAAPSEERIRFWRERLWQEILDAIWTKQPDYIVAHKISEALDISSELPEPAVEFLFSSCTGLRLDLIWQCQTPSIGPKAVEAWTRGLETGGALAPALESIFLAPRFIDAALELLRRRLAHPNRAVRLGVIRLLGAHGTQNDIALLALRCQQGVEPDELTLLGVGIATLAARTQRQSSE